MRARVRVLQGPQPSACGTDTHHLAVHARAYACARDPLISSCGKCVGDCLPVRVSARRAGACARTRRRNPAEGRQRGVWIDAHDCGCSSVSAARFIAPGPNAVAWWQWRGTLTSMLREREKVEQLFISASTREAHKHAGLPLPLLRPHTRTLPPTSCFSPLAYSSPPSHPHTLTLHHPRGNDLELVAGLTCARDCFVSGFVHASVHSKSKTNND